MTTYSLTEAQRHALQAYLQTECGLRCNAEYNPCEAWELDQMLQSLTPAPAQQEPVAWQERASRNVNPQGEITSWSGWYDCREPEKNYIKPENPRQETTYEWRPLYAAPAPQAQRELSDADWQVIADVLGCFITRTQKDQVMVVLKAAGGGV